MYGETRSSKYACMYVCMYRLCMERLSCCVHAILTGQQFSLSRSLSLSFSRSRSLSVSLALSLSLSLSLSQFDMAIMELHGTSNAKPAQLYDGGDLGISDCKTMNLSYLSWSSSAAGASPQMTTVQLIDHKACQVRVCIPVTDQGHCTQMNRVNYTYTVQ